jgi:hypothetical protein
MHRADHAGPELSLTFAASPSPGGFGRIIVRSRNVIADLPCRVPRVNKTACRSEIRTSLADMDRQIIRSEIG